VCSGVLLAGLLAALVTQTIPEEDTQVSTSAVPGLDFKRLELGANLAELERGRVYFAQLCVVCHGERGDGYGEWAYRVTPRPSDLTSKRVQSRSDAYLFNVISEGTTGTSMGGWKHRLSERQRWQLVTYLRHLGGR
jgi:mono/diheme cytochrome c family protein